MLTASVLSLAGATFPHKPRFTALQRAKAAHAVGIPAIGVTLTEQLSRAMLKYVQVPEGEWVDLRSAPSARQVARLRMLASEYGMERVNVGACDPGTTRATAAASLAALCDQLPDLTVAVEPVAFGSMHTLREVREVIRRAGSPPNAGILFDFWQVSQYDHIPAGALTDIAEVQMCGVKSPRDYADVHAASQDRMLIADYPDVPRMARLVNGSAAPVSYECPRAEYGYLELPKIAQAVADDMSKINGM
jgi:hypothetical protein